MAAGESSPRTASAGNARISRLLLAEDPGGWEGRAGTAGLRVRVRLTAMDRGDHLEGLPGIPEKRCILFLIVLVYRKNRRLQEDCVGKQPETC